ncbi:MAG: DUF4156 domain-containing protein [Gammaproteobacteria bacterium]|jgi:hypothetical protein|nr:MAG: DUF4156 domain-containing protein [Gammaproteobacteria bacterium]
MSVSKSGIESKFTKKALLILIVIGCSEVFAQTNEAPQQPEKTKTVTLIVGEEAPEGCELLGKVKGSSRENDSDTDKTPYVDRLIKARNNLRNETQKLGGNTVHVLYSNNSGRYEVPGAEKEIIFAGHAYRCE